MAVRVPVFHFQIRRPLQFHAWRMDRVVSLDAGEHGGTVETVPLDLNGERFHLKNAKLYSFSVTGA